MDPARWEVVERIFHACLETPHDDEPAYLDEACAGDREVRAAVEELLASHRTDPDFMAVPVARIAPVLGQTSTPDAPWSQAMELPSGGPVAPGGPTIPGYRIVRRLGRGGMGEVLLAVEEGAGYERHVAIKLIQVGLDSDEVLRRFRLERRILAGLNHPNIARLLDGGVTGDGRPFLVLEYVEGVPVDRFCDDNRLGVEARIALFQAVCAAVQYAHENLVLHRDLKPANVLVRDDGIPKLVDFGIAKLLALDPDTEGEVTLTRARALTPEHAAPEQLRGDPVSAATDVYGLGVLLHQLLTGVRPFVRGEGTWSELERAVLNDDPVRASDVVLRGAGAQARARVLDTDPRTLSRRLSGDLDTILAKALRKEPGRRYASVTALSDDLARHRKRLPVRARPDTVGYRTRRFVRRNLVPLAAGLTAAFALVGATVVSTVQSRRAQAEARRAQAERDKALEVQGFLLEMFGATGADREVGSTVSARTLLDRQAATLDEAFGSRPELKAEMTLVLAEGYDRLGLLDPAAALAQEAVALRVGAVPSDARELARARALLGWIRHEQGAAEEADRLLRTATATLSEIPGAERDLARALNDLGVTREAAGDLEEAEELYLRALELRRELQGADHRAVGVTASNLSVIRYRLADYAGAVAMADEALGILRQALGPDHQRATIVQSNLAAMQVALGDDRGAERQYRELLERQERLQGPDHPVTLQLVSSLGNVLTKLGEWSEAEVAFRRLVEARGRTLGVEHPQTVLSRVRLAQSLTGQGRRDEAAELAEPAVAALEVALGPDHTATAEAILTLAEARWESAPQSAETLHRAGIGILAAERGDRHPTTADARIRFGEFLGTQGRWAEAATEIEDAHVALAEVLPPTHRHVHHTRVRLAAALIRSGEGARADSVLRAARQAFAQGGADAALVSLADSLIASR